MSTSPASRIRVILHTSWQRCAIDFRSKCCEQVVTTFWTVDSAAMPRAQNTGSGHRFFIKVTRKFIVNNCRKTRSYIASVRKCFTSFVAAVGGGVIIIIRDDDGTMCYCFSWCLVEVREKIGSSSSNCCFSCSHSTFCLKWHQCRRKLHLKWQESVKNIMIKKTL